MPDHSVVHRYARCLSYPEWGVGTVNGIYFTGGGDDIQQWARVSFHLGVRTVPAGSLQFVDFSKPDPGAERVERFMTAAKHALAEGDFKLAARRLVYARDADPRNTAVLRLMTLAFWQAGDYSAAARAARDWMREEGDRPAPFRYAARIYEDMGSLSQAVEAAEKEVAARAVATRPPGSGSAACGCARSIARARATALERARELEPSEQGLLDLALVAQPDGRRRRRGHGLRAGDRCSRPSPPPPGRATPTRSPAPTACRTAWPPASVRSSCADDPEVRDLREQVLATAPRELTEAPPEGRPSTHTSAVRRTVLVPCA